MNVKERPAGNRHGKDHVLFIHIFFINFASFYVKLYLQIYFETIITNKKIQIAVIHM